MLRSSTEFLFQIKNRNKPSRNLRRRLIISCLLGTMAVVLWATHAEATILDMRNLVMANPSLVHHYTFEGTTTTQRQADKVGVGAVNLVPSVFGTGSAAAIAYVPGYDGVSVAMRPHYIDASNGAGFQTASTIALPGSGFTVEMLIAPGVTSGTDPGYAIAGPGSPNRAYPLLQREGDLKIAAGGLTFTDGNALRDVRSTYSTDDWYYVAVTMQNSGANTLVNAYVANLTAGETTLTQTLNNVSINGNYNTAASTLGIGKFPGGTQSLNGIMDELAIYNSLLSAGTLATHFQALLPPAPEPSSLMLLALGVVGLVRTASRRHRPGFVQSKACKRLH